MKHIIFLILCISWLIGGSYPSFHQSTSRKGLINELKELIKSSNGVLEQSASFVAYGEAAGTKDMWCGDSFNKIKVYIPAGLKRVRILIVAIPNSSYFILGRFIPSNGQITNIDWTKTKDFITYHDLSETYFTTATNAGQILSWWDGAERYYNLDVSKFEGGWLYVQLIQASNMMYSDFGHINGPSVQFIVKYYYDPKYKNKLDEWLKSTEFDPETGDPVDGFDFITEKVRDCSDFGRQEKIYGIKSSGITGYELLYGIQPDPNKPKLSIQSNISTPKTDDTLTYTIEAQAGQKDLGGISVEVNQNTTTGVLLQDNISSSCLSFVDASGSDDLAQGSLVYSDNGQNWYTNPNDDAIKDNIRYVGYLVPDVLPTAKKATLNVAVKVGANCSGVLTNRSDLLYSIDGVDQSVTKSLSLSMQTAPTYSTGGSGGSTLGGTTYGGSLSTGGGTTTGGSTTTDSNAKKYCEDHGGTWVDGTCLSGGTDGNGGSFFQTQPSSSSQPSNTSGTTTDSNAKKYCEDHGGTWIDGTCLSGGVQQGGQNTSSSVGNTSGVKSQAQKYCEDHGGTWADGTCVSGNSSQETSSESSSAPSKIVQVVYTIATKEQLPVEGYFAHYGSGAFDWIYRTAGGGLYKLDGMDENGYFKWTNLSDYFSEVKIVDNKLVVGEPKNTRALEIPDKRVSQVVERLLEQKEFSIDGYFVHYGDGAFDWALRTAGGGLYKLDGMDENGYFKWTNLSDYFSEVKIVDNKLVVGEPKNISSANGSSSTGMSEKEKLLEKMKTNCYQAGGTWDEDRMLCVLVETSESSVTSSQSSSTSSQSSSSSIASSTSSSSESTQSSSANAFPSIS